MLKDHADMHLFVDNGIHVCDALQSTWTKKKIQVKKSQTNNSESRQQQLHILDLRLWVSYQTVSSLQVISGLKGIVMFTLHIFVLI